MLRAEHRIKYLGTNLLNLKVIASFEGLVLKSRNVVLTPMELRKGMVFGPKGKLSHIVKQVHIRCH